MVFSASERTQAALIFCGEHQLRLSTDTFCKADEMARAIWSIATAFCYVRLRIQNTFSIVHSSGQAILIFSKYPSFECARQKKRKEVTLLPRKEKERKYLPLVGTHTCTQTMKYGQICNGLDLRAVSTDARGLKPAIRRLLFFDFSKLYSNSFSTRRIFNT